MTDYGALRLAVLIDGENVPARDAAALFAKVASLGNPIIRRVYGDFTKSGVNAWPRIISQHGGSAEQAGHTSAGKNASDIALVVDAMDMLHKRAVDGFCIVSSDGDFSSLAKRIREDGLKIYAFGHGAGSAALKAACDGFFVLAEPASQPKPVTKAVPKPATPPPAKHQPQLAREAIASVLAANPSDWMTMSALGSALRARDADYLKKTGFGSLKKLLTALNERFETGTAADGKTAQVRRRA